MIESKSFKKKLKCMARTIGGFRYALQYTKEGGLLAHLSSASKICSFESSERGKVIENGRAANCVISQAMDGW